MLYKYTIYPLECIYKVLYLFFAEALDHYGLALIVLSLMTSFIIHPFMKWATKLQKEEKHLQDVMKPQLDIIKEDSKGAEQYERIQRMYKRYGYHPVMAIRSAIGVALQIPFLMAAFYMLSKLPDIQGVPWGFIKDLGKPDSLLLGRFNVLPFVMTAVNLLGAYTTKGFNKRDRLQAIVIATLFLVLLYTAPSALLIYWTCNNLWTFLGNSKDIVFEKYNISTPAIRIKGKNITEWFIGMPDELYVCLGLAVTVCVLIPADVYLVNSGELWFTLRDLLKYLVPGAAVVFVVLTAIYFILQRNLLRAGFAALVLGLLLGFWLQSYVINLDYGILDGRTIQWGALKKEAVFNCIAWLICIILPFIGLKYLQADKFVKFAKKIALLLLFVQLISSFYTAGSSKNAASKKPNDTILTTEGEFTASTNDNIIVFVLDAFESKVFQEIQQKEPDLIQKFNGFTHYPDAVSYFGLTDYSLPQMLTNRVYSNKGGYSDYLKIAWKKNPFYEILKRNNYDVRIYTYSSFIFGAEDYIDNLKTTKYVVDNTTMTTFVKLVLFRELPHLMKKPYVIYSGDLRIPVTDTKASTPYKEDDVAYYNELKRNGIKLLNDKNCFRFYHLNGVHVPLTMNRNIQRRKKGENITLHDQAVASLKIVAEYIEQMKQHNIYKNATVVILADHGIHNNIASPPLVLVKEANADANRPIVKSNNAISYAGLQATLAQRLGKEGQKLGIAFNMANEKERTFYAVRSSKTQDLALDEYKVEGVAENKDAWKLIRQIKNFMDNTDDSYTLGTKIEFSTMGTSSNYTRAGWKRPILDHRWIDKAQAKCSFTLKNYSEKDLILSVHVSASLMDKAKSRNVSVYANGKKICLWKIGRLQLFKVKIPKRLIKGNKLNLLFKVENPIPKNIDSITRQISVRYMKIE